MLNLGHGGRISLDAVEVPPTSPGASTVAGAGVDMRASSGSWDRVVFKAALGVIGNAGNVDMYATESANANFSGEINITGAAITQVLNGVSNVVVALDVVRPTNRYVRCKVVITANNANIAVMSERYRGGGTMPHTLPTNSQYVVAAAN